MQYTLFCYQYTYYLRLDVTIFHFKCYVEIYVTLCKYTVALKDNHKTKNGVAVLSNKIYCNFHLIDFIELFLFMNNLYFAQNKLKW